MKCEEIYRAVLAVLAETDPHTDLSDYEERFPFILATFANQNAKLDEILRSSHGEKIKHRVYIGTDGYDEFPLSDVFLTAAVMYSASMLVLDENAELSDKLFDRYTVAMTELCGRLPLEHTDVANVYGEM